MSIKKIIILLGFVMIGCSQNNAEDHPEVINNPEYGVWQLSGQQIMKANVIRTFGTDTTGVMFSDVTDILTDPDGNLIVLDRSTPMLASFDTDGNLNWMNQSQGEGPGDLLGPVSMVLNNEGQLYLSNQYGSRVDIFSSDGEFQGSLRLPDPLKAVEIDLISLRDNSLLMTVPAGKGLSRNFYRFITGPEPALTDSFNIDLSGAIDYPFGMCDFSTISSINEQLIIPDMKEYYLHAYDRDGELMRKISRDKESIYPPGVYDQGGNRIIGTFSRIEKVLEIPNGMKLLSAYWTTNIRDPARIIEIYITGAGPEVEYKNTLDLYSEDWKLLYSIETEGPLNEEFGRPVHVDDRGNIYAVKNTPFEHLVKYELVINEPAEQ